MIDSTSCDATVFVATNGSDLVNSGTIDSPFATLRFALSFTRSIRSTERIKNEQRGSETDAPSSSPSSSSSSSSPCIFLRAGTYFLGADPPRTAGNAYDSQYGYIDLLPIDSGLTIAAYNDETVVLSGGAPITPEWVKYKSVDAGTIYYTTLSSSSKDSSPFLTDAFHLNELFVDGSRAVRAKWPNGDPSTHIRHSTPAAYDNETFASWLPVRTFGEFVDVKVGTPVAANESFPYFEMGLGGPAVLFDPPRSYWAQKSPNGGGSFVIPSGINITSSQLASRAASWSNPSTGFVHAFHGSNWGNWIFAIDDVNVTLGKLTFGAGGFQEARGHASGADVYVEFLLEELDEPNEWFFDEAQSRLYYMFNASASDVGDVGDVGDDVGGFLPDQPIIISQLPCIISAHGTAAQPVANVVLSGLTLAHTSNTMMRGFEVPSGGDWSLHRGGALFATGTQNLLVQNSVFALLGGTAVVISNWNLGATVATSEFVWGLDSGIVVIGTLDGGIDGVTNLDQPSFTTITNNLFHELGIVIKQSAPVFVGVSRSTTIARNVMFNVPRAGININDGFYGNKTIEGNVIFNTVRETSDHGPINTWDRLPALTMQWDDAERQLVPSMYPAKSSTTRNLLFNTYASVWPIDHDDGSHLYDDSFNVLIYGGFKSYKGNSLVAHDSLYIYPDGRRFDVDAGAGARVGAGASERVGAGGSGTFCAQTYVPSSVGDTEHESWSNNTCILQQSMQPYEFLGCQINEYGKVNLNRMPSLANNQLYFTLASDGGAVAVPETMSSTIHLDAQRPYRTYAQIPCQYSNGTTIVLTLSEIQAYGTDIGSVEGVNPGIDTILAWATTMFYESG